MGIIGWAVKWVSLTPPHNFSCEFSMVVRYSSWLSDIIHILWIFDFEVNLYSRIVFDHVVAVSNVKGKPMLHKISTNNLLFELDQFVFKIYFLLVEFFLFICTYFSEDFEMTDSNVIHMFFYFYVVLPSFSYHDLDQ